MRCASFSPKASPRTRIFSSSNTSSTAKVAAQATGLPVYVPPQGVGAGAVHDGVGTHHTGDGHSIRHTFGDGNNIWLNATVLDGKHFTAAAKATLHFIHNHQNAVLVTQLADCLEKRRRRGVKATFTNNGLY